MRLLSGRVDQVDEDVLEARLVGRQVLEADAEVAELRISEAMPVRSALLSKA